MEFAGQYVSKVTQIHSDIEAVVDTSPIDVTLTPACLVVIGTFQLVQPKGCGQDSWGSESHHMCARPFLA